jgi:hypothetical protein
MFPEQSSVARISLPDGAMREEFDPERERTTIIKKDRDYDHDHDHDRDHDKVIIDRR